MSRERQRGRELRRQMLKLVVLKKRFIARVCLLICLLFQSVEGEDIQRHRSFRRSMSTLTQTLFPQVMHEYFVFLLQIVQAEGNFFLHEDITREKKTYEVAKAWEYEGTICACHMNETNHVLTINSMRLLRDVYIAIVSVLARRIQRLGRI